MKVLALIFIICSLSFGYSQDDVTQQITLSCPTNSKLKRGYIGFPGKRGSKGEPDIRGEYKFAFCGFAWFYYFFLRLF